MRFPVRFAAILVLAAFPGLAQHPWRPSPGMTGSFHAVAGSGSLDLDDSGKLTLSRNGTSSVTGILRPDPSGIPNHYLAKFVDSDGGDIFFYRFAFEPGETIWQLLAIGESPGDMKSLKEELSRERDGFVSYELGWFKSRFVSDRPVSPDAVSASDVCARLAGIWENFREGFNGSAVLLCPDGTGLFGAAGLSVPFTWKPLRTNDTWFVACTAYEGMTRPGPASTTTILLKPARRFQHLRLVALDQPLEAAVAAAEALSAADGSSPLYYHSSPTAPPELASGISAAISSLRDPARQPASESLPTP